MQGKSVDRTKAFVVEPPEGERPVVIVDGEVREDVTPPPAVFLHNWLYSIVPGPNFEIYAAGFCKNCKTAFTKKLAVSQFRDTPIKYTTVEVDKYGCVGP